MPTIDQRLRKLEERTRPEEDQRRPAGVAFVLELHKQPNEDMHLVLELSDRLACDRWGQPRIQMPAIPESYLSDEDLMKRYAVIVDRIEAELIRQGFTKEELMQLSEADFVAPRHLNDAST